MVRLSKANVYEAYFSILMSQDIFQVQASEVEILNHCPGQFFGRSSETLLKAAEVVVNKSKAFQAFPQVWQNLNRVEESS